MTTTCACGCNTPVRTPDPSGRRIRYARGHNPRNSPVMDAVLRVLATGPADLSRIFREGDLWRWSSWGSLRSACFRLVKRGRIVRVGEGEYCGGGHSDGQGGLTMTTDERIALLERLDAMISRGCTSDECCAHASRDRMDDADRAAISAWTAELEAEPPWLDAPDGPGPWWCGCPGYGAREVTVEYRHNALWVDDGDPHTDFAPGGHHLAGHRYQRRQSVFVPPRSNEEPPR